MFNFLSSKRVVLFHLALLLLFLSYSLFHYSYVMSSLKKQDSLAYYVNISGKQRVLAQRIVFLSQIIATNNVLKRDNYTPLSELRDCIEQLSTIHKMMERFVVSVILENSDKTTLGDVYFGGANLSFKMLEFLDESNKMLLFSNTGDVLQINQNLLGQLEGNEGLLNTLDLAVLSNQLYFQNFIKNIDSRNSMFFYSLISFLILEVLYVFWILFRRQ